MHGFFLGILVPNIEERRVQCKGKRKFSFHASWDHLFPYLYMFCRIPNSLHSRAGDGHNSTLGIQRNCCKKYWYKHARKETDMRTVECYDLQERWI